MPIPAAIIAAIIAAAGTATSTAATNVARKRAQDREFSTNYKMWKESNAYNDPSAQMARLKAAGLNPNLVYGQSVSGATGNTATSTPKYQAEAVDYSGLGEAAGSVMSNYLDYRQVVAQTAGTRAATEGQILDNAIKAKDLGLKSEFLDGQLEALTLSNRSKAIDNEIAEQYGQPQAMATLGKTQADTDVSKARVSEIGANIKRTEVDTMRIEAQIDHINAGAAYTRQQLAKLVLETALVEEFGRPVEAAKLENLKQQLANLSADEQLTLKRTIQQMVDTDKEFMYYNRNEPEWAKAIYSIIDRLIPRLSLSFK